LYLGLGITVILLPAGVSLALLRYWSLDSGRCISTAGTEDRRLKSLPFRGTMVCRPG
jgi:hypothetical protein